MLIESRQDIKARILRVLSRSWGHQGVESEEAFDPIIQLLINAIAGELERISGEAYTSHLRLADRLSELLVPGIAISAFPAHSIVVATPNDESEIITPQHQFFHTITEENHFSSLQKQKQIYFSPSNHFQLHRTEVKYIAAKNQLVVVENKRYKELYAESKKRLPNSQIWIGITTEKLQKEVKNLRFYFELDNKEHQEYFNYYLKQSEWFLGENKIEMQAGYESEICGEKINLTHVRSGTYSDVVRQLEEVNLQYRDNFLTLKSFDFTSKDVGVPQEITHIFGENLNKVDDILWFRVQFYETIQDNLLKQLSVYANAFPVVNRKLNELTSRMEYMLNIIPLQDDDYFWNLEEAADTDGIPYHIKDISEQESLNKRTALLRREGVGRLDQRSAITQIQNLMNAIKDERASFAKVDSDTLSQNLKDLTAALNRISETVDNVVDVQDTAFLVVKNENENNEDESVFVKFWTTAGKIANGISAGVKLDSEYGIDLLDKEALMITTTVGGKDRANREEMLSKMRKNWLTRNRVVTNQDIVNLCHEHFSGRILEVKIQKGISTDSSKKYGLNRTLDVFIKPNPDAKIPDNEWNYLQNSFYDLLKHNSSNAFKYQIFKVEK